MELRDYQKRTIEEIEAYLAISDRAIVTVPGGGGKSALIAEIARQAQEEKEVCVVLTNITALISQLSKHLDEMGVRHNIIKAGQERKDENAYVHLIMEQSYHKDRRDKEKIKADIVCKDEYHIGVNQKRFEDIIKDLEPSKIVGFTFTPYDEKGYLLTNHTHDELIKGVEIKELIDNGYLVPLKYYVPKWAEQVDYSELDIKGNDYSENDIASIINTPEYLNLSLQSMNAMNAKEKKVLVYCAGIEHAENMCKILQKDGYKAAVVHSKKPKDENQRIIASYKDENQGGLVKDEVNCLVSVSSLQVGFDAPNTQLLVLMRKSAVRRMMQQIVARNTRPYPGKEYGEILDLANYIQMHGFLHEEDMYFPPVKGDKKALLKEKQKFEAPIVGSIVTSEPTEVTRELIDVAIREVKSREKKIPELDMKTLTDLFEVTSDVKTIIWIGFEIAKRVRGQAYKETTIEWAVNPWRSFIEDYPEYEQRILKTIKTRIKNIVKKDKKMASIHYFCSFLREQEPYSFYDTNIPF